MRCRFHKEGLRRQSSGCKSLMDSGGRLSGTKNRKTKFSSPANYRWSHRYNGELIAPAPSIDHNYVDIVPHTYLSDCEHSKSSPTRPARPPWFVRFLFRHGSL